MLKFSPRWKVNISINIKNFNEAHLCFFKVFDVRHCIFPFQMMFYSLIRIFRYINSISQMMYIKIKQCPFQIWFKISHNHSTWHDITNIYSIVSLKHIFACIILKAFVSFIKRLIRISFFYCLTTNLSSTAVFQTESITTLHCKHMTTPF